jgi:PAS domain S-box-containing protein
VTPEDKPIANITDLLCRTEAVARLDPPLDPEPLSAKAMQRTVRQLRLQQIELEMQNEELLRSQVELARSRARYFDLYDQAPVGYCTLSAQGLILEANLTALTLLGAVRGDLIHEPFTRFIFNPDQDQFYLHRRQLLTLGGGPPCDLRMVRLDGTVIWVRLTTTMARVPWAGTTDEPEAAPTLRIVLADIGERKRLERENALLLVTLHEAQKLEALGVVAGGVAHDFNNLLTSILGNANLGTLGAAPGGAEAGCFLVIEKAALRAAELTRQLLAYAGKGRFPATQVDLGILVQEVTLLLAVSKPSQVTFRCDLADPLPLVQGDPTQLFQVVLNLVTNATEAFPAGVAGQVTLRTRNEQVDQATIDTGPWCLVLAPGHYVTLEVTDTGTGMQPEVAALAFDPFFTTKFSGCGLGLAAVIGTLRSHRGGMMVRSQPGQGSSFKLFLPALEEPRPPILP